MCTLNSKLLLLILLSFSMIILLLMTTNFAKFKKTKFGRLQSTSIAKKDEPQLKITLQDSSGRTSPVLTKRIEKGIKKLLLFAGWPRSCGSFVGSILDGHPNMIIANIFSLFPKLESGKLKFEISTIFNALYEFTQVDKEEGQRANAEEKKGYQLMFDDMYQGTFVDHVDVIGEKHALGLPNLYMHHPEKFKSILGTLQKKLGIPVYIIRVIRNPYDNIATWAMYEKYHLEGILQFKKDTKEKGVKFNDSAILDRISRLYFKAYKATEDIKLLADESTDIYCAELIRNPEAEIRRICSFLEVECYQEYVSSVVSHVYPSDSSTRDYVQWPKNISTFIENSIRTFGVSL